MIHPLADIQSSNIGMGTQIWQFSVILKGAVIGANCNINCHTFIENDVVIGNNVTVKSGVYLWDGIRIMNDVFIGPNVTFTNDPKPRSKQRPEAFSKTLVQQGASIGANSTVIGGVTIGEYAMIGAGSLITCDVSPFTLWYGSPASHKGFVTREGITLNLSLMDKNGDQYQLIDKEPKRI